MEPTRSFLEPVPGNLRLPGRLKNADRYSISCSWRLLDHSLNLQTPHQALRKPPRRSCGAPEHLQELSSSLQGPSFELPNISRSSQAVSQDRIPSSRASRGAVKQPPRNEFRAPKQASQEESKQSKGKRASKQPSKQASNQTSKRANEQTSKRANEQARTRPKEQTSKQPRGRRGAPKGLQL